MAVTEIPTASPTYETPTQTGPGRPDPANPVALIVYGSRYGNTARIASALARGLAASGAIAVESSIVEDCPPERAAAADLLIVGGPTEAFSASGPVKRWLDSLAGLDLRGKAFFAFDTRIDSRLSGSAGGFIERSLERLGGRPLRPHRSAIVRGVNRDERRRTSGMEAGRFPPTVTPSPAAPGAPSASAGPELPRLLAPGSEEEFERLGGELASALHAAAPPRSPPIAT